MSLEFSNPSHTEHELNTHITLLNKMQELLIAIREHSLPSRKETTIEVPIERTYSSFPPVLRDYLVVDSIDTIDFTFIEEETTDHEFVKRTAVEFSTGTPGVDARTVFLHDPVPNSDGLPVAYKASLVGSKLGPEPETLPDIPIADVTRLFLEAFGLVNASGADLQYIDLLTEERFETVQSLAEMYGFQNRKTSRYEFDDATSIELVYTDLLQMNKHGNELPSEIFINIAKGQITVQVTSDEKFSIEVREDGILITRPEQLLINEIVANIDEVISNVSANHTIEAMSPHELDHIVQVLEEEA